MAEICYHKHRLLIEGIWSGSDGKTGILHGKSQIFQEMISRISKLSQDSYLMVTDMQHNLTFVPESTAEFLGIPSGWCEDGYKIVLEKSVHPLTARNIRKR